MSNEDIVNEIQDFVDNLIKDLPNKDYVEILNEIASNFQIQADAQGENEDE